MSKTSFLNKAFVLHSRPYRNTSLLLDLFCDEFGRISAVAKAGRKRWPSSLQPFQSLLIAYSGSGDLVTLTQVEVEKIIPAFSAKRLFCGLYLNELLMRLTIRHDPNPQLFADYSQCLERLARGDDEEITLREFEFSMLSSLGYAIDFLNDAQCGERILPERNYFFKADLGFCQLSQYEDKTGRVVFSGKDIATLQCSNFNDARIRRLAKCLTRLAITPLLGGKPLQSRALFQN